MTEVPVNPAAVRVASSGTAATPATFPPARTAPPDPDDGRSTLALLTDVGWEKVVATAPGHVAEVRRLVLDPLSRGQVRQLREIAGRIQQAAHPDGCSPALRVPDEA